MRTEFGFERTTCGCELCQLGCRHLPGYLVPADLERMKAFLAKWHQHPFSNLCWTMKAFAEEWLLASPGALVQTGERRWRIHTIVPRKAKRACIFFDGGRCQIHEVAPYGCAFFDFHQSLAEGRSRATPGLTAIYEDHRVQGPYTQLWNHLHARGLIADDPKIGFRAMGQAEKEMRSRNEKKNVRT